MYSACNETGDMSHIHHEVSADFLSDLAEGLEVDDPGVSRCAGKYKLRMMLQSQLSDVFHIDETVVIYIIEYKIVSFAGEVYGRTVSKMSAVIQVKAQNCVARLKDRFICGKVSLRT